MGTLTTCACETPFQEQPRLTFPTICAQFHSGYLSQGFLGGTRAAIALYQQVRELIATKEPHADPTSADILALVFLCATCRSIVWTLLRPNHSQ